jgi:hypothetical protein
MTSAIIVGRAVPKPLRYAISVSIGVSLDKRLDSETGQSLEPAPPQRNGPMFHFPFGYNEIKLKTAFIKCSTNADALNQRYHRMTWVTLKKQIFFITD